MEITCKNLSIGYDNVVLHENINLTIPKGSYTCIIGENGIGKSTLIKTLLGLLPPISGEIIIKDLELDHAINPRKKKNRDKGVSIGYLPQQTQVQKNFPASVYEVTLSGCLNKTNLRPFYTREEKNLVFENLEKLGVRHLIKKSYSELSGGQQQRILLARALCAAKDVLLLDEPTAGLDPDATKEFYRIVKELNGEDVTIVMITHNLEAVLDSVDFILHIGKSSISYLTKIEYERQYGGDSMLRCCVV